jgi:OmpA-OmpF porin, OOP family
MGCRGAVVLPVLAGVCAASLGSELARAADCAGVVNACINDDVLWPHAGATRFVAVGSTETIAPGEVGFALVTSYLSRPVVLHLPSPGPAANGINANAVNDQANSTFSWAYGVTRRLELDLSLPITLAQGGTGLAPITGGKGLKDTAVRDMRFGVTYALVAPPRVAPDLMGGPFSGKRDVWGVVGRFDVSAPTGDQDQFAGERAGVFAPSISGSYRRGALATGIEIGARVRPTNELLNARIGTQIVAAVGVGWDFLPRELLAVAIEVWALPTLAQQDHIAIVGGTYVGSQESVHIAPAEWQLSVRTAPLPGGDLSIELGGGTGIPIGGELPVTTPRFRFTLGLRWAPLGRDTDGDGLADSVDQCPTIPAPRTATGCPVSPGEKPAPVDVTVQNK